VPKIDVIQFCKENCSVTKVIIPLRKGNKKTSKTSILYRKI